MQVTPTPRPAAPTPKAPGRAWLAVAWKSFACIVAMSCSELLVWRVAGRVNDTAAVLAATLVAALATAAVAALLARLLPAWLALLAALAWPTSLFVHHLDQSLHLAIAHTLAADLLVTVALTGLAVATITRRVGRILLAAAAAVVALASLQPLVPRRGTASAITASDHPDVVLVVFDTTRRDHVSLYGYPRATTPNLERLARAAAVYDDAWSVSNWTPSSHATMFTGLLPAEHGVDGDAQPAFETDADRLPQLLHDAGYATAGFPANPNLMAPGWERGFDTYHAPWIRGPHTLVEPMNRLLDEHKGGWVFEHGTQRVLARARSWWSDHGDRPRFLFVNLIDPHFPYSPPPDYYRRFLPATPRAVADAVDQTPVHYLLHPGVTPAEREILNGLYDAELAALDDEAGRFFDWLAQRGELDRTIVCVTADHGERLGERGFVGHDLLPDPTLLRVPLLLRCPAQITPGRVKWRVQLDGLPGELLRLAGVDPPGRMAERGLGEPGVADVVAQLQEPRGFERRIANVDRDHDTTLLRGDWSFVSDGRYGWTWSTAWPDEAGVLIDYAKDPEATHDLAAELPEVAARLARIGRALPKFTPKRVPVPRDGDDRARLRELGYR